MLGFGSKERAVRILVADAIDEAGLAPLVDAGHDVTVSPDLGADDLVEHLAGVDALVVRSTKVTAAAIEAADTLSLIVRAGAGTDNIDTDVAATRGVYVTNVPGRNAIAVAELAMGLLLAIDRRIVDGAVDLREGVWKKGEYRKAEGLFGKTMAILGVGAIGLAVAERAKAFGITVMAMRRSGRSEEIEARIRQIGIRLVDTEDELLGGADIVSIHVPSVPATAGLVNADFLAKMRDGAILINTARGETIDGAALLDALNERGMRAGLDVWPDEPKGGSGTFESDLATHPRVVGSHHIGASTDQSQAAIVEGTVETLLAYCGGVVMNCVNLETAALGSSALTVRHEDKVGVLAQVFEILRTSGLNVKQMSNQVFAGSIAAVAKINVDGEVSDQVVSQLRSIEEVIGVEHLELAA